MMDQETRLDVFFYGLFMDERILRAKGVEPRSPRRAIAPGFQLAIGDRARLVRRFTAQACGMLFEVSRAETELLYSAPGLEEYRVEPVTVYLESGASLAALTFNLDAAVVEGERNVEYVASLLQILSELGFPEPEL